MNYLYAFRCACACEIGECWKLCTVWVRILPQIVVVGAQRRFFVLVSRFSFHASHRCTFCILSVVSGHSTAQRRIQWYSYFNTTEHKYRRDQGKAIITTKGWMNSLRDVLYSLFVYSAARFSLELAIGLPQISAIYWHYHHCIPAGCGKIKPLLTCYSAASHVSLWIWIGFKHAMRTRTHFALNPLVVAFLCGEIRQCNLPGG